MAPLQREDHGKGECSTSTLRHSANTCKHNPHRNTNLKDATDLTGNGLTCLAKRRRDQNTSSIQGAPKTPKTGAHTPAAEGGSF